MASRSDAPLTSGQLGDLLGKLEKVMEEAKRLREHIARQLSDQRQAQQQRLAPVRKRPTRKR